MLRERHQLFLACLLAAAFLPRLIAGQDYVGPGFDTCKTRTYKILNGSEAWHGISNETIGQYIYDGPVRGMNPDYERTWRKNFTTLTTEGMLLNLTAAVYFIKESLARLQSHLRRSRRLVLEGGHSLDPCYHLQLDIADRCSTCCPSLRLAASQE